MLKFFAFLQKGNRNDIINKYNASKTASFTIG